MLSHLRIRAALDAGTRYQGYAAHRAAMGGAEPEASSSSGSKTPLYVGLGFAVLGVLVLTKTDVSSQEDWNQRYGKG